MWKRGAPVQARAPEPFTANEALENVVTGDVRDIANQEFAQYFEAMLLATRSGITKDAVRLDDFLERHWDWVS